MKALTFSRLFLIGALILGLVFAWANAVPKVTSGEIFGGANCGCKYDLNFQCSSAGCFSVLLRCHNTGSGAWDWQDDTKTCSGIGENCDDYVEEKCK